MVKGLGIAPGSFLSEGSEVIIHIFPYTARQLNQKMTHSFHSQYRQTGVANVFYTKSVYFLIEKNKKVIR